MVKSPDEATDPLRSRIGGWSTGSVRRNTAFLRSVQE